MGSGKGSSNMPLLRDEGKTGLILLSKNVLPKRLLAKMEKEQADYNFGMAQIHKDTYGCAKHLESASFITGCQNKYSFIVLFKNFDESQLSLAEAAQADQKKLMENWKDNSASFDHNFILNQIIHIDQNGQEQELPEMSPKMNARLQKFVNNVLVPGNEHILFKAAYKRACGHEGG